MDGRSRRRNDRSLFFGAMMPESPSKPRVLIADDERVIADTLAMILNHGGFEARAVYSCIKALEMAPDFKPDLLISDVIMSDLNGIEAAVRMKALLPDIRVFLLSGQTATAEMLEREKATGYGFEVLIKPLHPTDLIRKLRDTMQENAEPATPLPAPPQ
jgi:CheY-like chemotaxis protein